MVTQLRYIAYVSTHNNEQYGIELHMPWEVPLVTVILMKDKPWSTTVIGDYITNV